MKFSGIRSLAASAGHLTGARLLTHVVRAVYVVALAHYLGPEMYGLFAYGQSWYMAFLPLTALGLAAVLSREVGVNREQAAEVVARTLRLRTLSALGGAIACGLVGWISDAEPAAQQLLVIFSLALAGRGLATWAEQVFIAYEASRYTLQQEAVFRPLEVAVGLAVLAAGGGVTAIAAVHALIWWLQAARGLALVHRRLVSLRPDGAWRGLTRLAVQGLPICLATLFSSWLLLGPLVMFRHVAGTEGSLGQLALALQAVVLVGTVPWSIGSAALPVLSRSAAREDGKVLRFADGMLRLGLLLGAAAGLAGMALGPWLVETVFGGRYGPAGQLLGPALWLLVPLTAGSATAQVLMARGRFVSPALCALAGALVLTLLLPTLVSASGPQGAVLAAGAGMCVWASSLVAMLARFGGLDLGRGVLRPGVVVLVALGVYMGLEPVGIWLALTASWLVLLGGTLAIGVLAPEERSALMALLRRTRWRRGA